MATCQTEKPISKFTVNLSFCQKNFNIYAHGWALGMLNEFGIDFFL